MRSAEAIQLQFCGLCDNAAQIQNAIREAQREAVQEAAEVARAYSEGAFGASGSVYVDKQSILQLLNQIQ